MAVLLDETAADRQAGLWVNNKGVSDADGCPGQRRSRNISGFILEGRHVACASRGPEFSADPNPSDVSPLVCRLSRNCLKKRKAGGRG